MPINPTRRKADKSGFSLLELLLVLTLAPIVFFAVYSDFSTGVRLWQRIQVQTPEEDLVIFYQKAGKDLKNAVRFSTIPFSGEKEEVAFAASIETEPALGGDRGIGLVRYYYDSSDKVILREVKNFSELYKEAPGKESLLLGGVSSFEIAYFFFDNSSHENIWSGSFRPDKPGSLPLAVRFSYSLKGSREKCEQTFFIPAGGSLK